MHHSLYPISLLSVCLGTSAEVSSLLLTELLPQPLGRVLKMEVLLVNPQNSDLSQALEGGVKLHASTGTLPTGCMC